MNEDTLNALRAFAEIYQAFASCYDTCAQMIPNTDREGVELLDQMDEWLDAVAGKYCNGDRGRLHDVWVTPDWQKYDLDELLAGVTPENRHPEIDWGPPVGKEFW